MWLLRVVRHSGGLPLGVAVLRWRPVIVASWLFALYTQTPLPPQEKRRFAGFAVAIMQFSKIRETGGWRLVRLLG